MSLRRRWTPLMLAHSWRLLQRISLPVTRRRGSGSRRANRLVMHYRQRKAANICNIVS